MTCKDCLHYEVCVRRTNSISLDPMKCGYKCPEIKSKADFAEVRRGKWELLNNEHFNCTQCGHVFTLGSTATIYSAKQHWQYCPKCGAKMEG